MLFAQDIDARIANLTALKTALDGCIGCGCLSPDRCAIWNPQDNVAAEGPGPRNLLRDMTDLHPAAPQPK